MSNKENNHLSFIMDIAWDFKQPYNLDEEYLFYLIEKRWRYIDHDNLSDEETKYIKYLVNEYGKGVILI